MSEAQWRATGKVVLKALRTNGDGCPQFVWKRDPKEGAALFVSGFVLESIFPDNPATRTPENIGVGSSESQVMLAYRNVEHPIPRFMYALHNPKVRRSAATTCKPMTQAWWRVHLMGAGSPRRARGMRNGRREAAALREQLEVAEELHDADEDLSGLDNVASLHHTRF